jgi:hypothetical protein
MVNHNVLVNYISTVNHRGLNCINVYVITFVISGVRFLKSGGVW